MMHAGVNELAGNVAVIDGKLYPLEEFHYNVDNDYETVFSGAGTQGMDVKTGTEIYGTLESYRKVPMPNHLGQPNMHDLYLFSAEAGTAERFYFSGVFFEPTFAENRGTQTVDFMAKDITID